MSGKLNKEDFLQTLEGASKAEVMGESVILPPETVYEKLSKIAKNYGYRKEESGLDDGDEGGVWVFDYHFRGDNQKPISVELSSGGCFLSFLVDDLTGQRREVNVPSLESSAFDKNGRVDTFFFNAANHHDSIKTVKVPSLSEKEKERTDFDRHFQFESILAWVKEDPVWLWSAPAAGKTYMARQIAEELGVDFYPIALGPKMGESKLIGYMNAAHGEYVPGLCYEPWQKGNALLFFDEIDVADPQCLVALNSLLDNDYYRFPDGVLLDRPDNLYILAAANTPGTGGVGNFKRNAHDAALLDRFVKFKMRYDLELESHISGEPEWAAYVAAVRGWIEEQATGRTPITPRITYKGARALRRGAPPEEVFDVLIGGAMNPDIKDRMIASIGVFDPSVDYTKTGAYKKAISYA